MSYKVIVPRLCLEIERMYTKLATFRLYMLGFNRVEAFEDPIHDGDEPHGHIIDR